MNCFNDDELQSFPADVIFCFRCWHWRQYMGTTLAFSVKSLDCDLSRYNILVGLRLPIRSTQNNSECSADPCAL